MCFDNFINKFDKIFDECKLFSNAERKYFVLC